MTAAGRLTGETAIVTGSTSGLGVVIAARFVAEGARVVVTGRDRARGDSVAGRIGAAFVPADLADEQQCRRLVEASVEILGSLTVLVNNARSQAVSFTDASDATEGLRDGRVGEVTWPAWEEILRVGTVAPAVLTGLSVPHMVRAGHGSIVNVSSRAAAVGTPGYAAYAASKAALEALARSVTAEYARHGVRCNTVRPGYIRHEQRDEGMTTEQWQAIEAMHLTRVPTADDVASAVVFLASSEAEVVSGVALPVDGGSSAVRGRTLG